MASADMTRYPVLTGSHVASRRLRSIPHDHKARAMRDPDAIFALRADNLRRTQRATRIANPANDRGWAHRHEEIGARQSLLPWWAVAFALGFVLYFGAQMLRAVLS